MTLVAPIVLAAVLGASPGGACETTDLMPAFWRFWERAEGQPASRQYALFDELVRTPNSAIYEGVFYGAPKPPAEFVPDALAKVPGLEARMRALSGRLAEDLPRELDAFRKAFPKFRCDVPVYFVYSRLDEELSPLVVHELFHVYQGQIVPEPPATVAWGLWQEGLATYVSRKLNPDVPEPKVCCLPPLEPVKADLPRIAADLLARLDSTEQSDNARYFLGGQELDIPSRSGYYLGYLIASEAGRTRSLEELAAMKPAEVRGLEEKELRRLAASAAAPR